MCAQERALLVAADGAPTPAPTAAIAATASAPLATIVVSANETIDGNPALQAINRNVQN